MCWFRCYGTRLLCSSLADLELALSLQAGYWREYADHVMATGDEAAVKAVFSRCLLTCLSVDLWRAYLNFIKRVRLRLVLCWCACDFVRLASGSGCGDILGCTAG